MPTLSSDIAISCENVGKRYRLGMQAGYRTLREVLSAKIASGFQSAKSPTKDVHLWALDDVSLEIKRGEVVGIIGHNGAGKSTLLKILSRITKPTRGSAQINGRVGSLLEVGTGFHPELTGRENIYLNGAILGMRKSEIERKFDEIVAFAEVEKFIDTPVKRFSSGMYVRLAFGVAAHLETEVLLVDEVLAVGDAQFQKKCFAKINEIGKDGRTILFVSHNMAAVRSICKQAVVLDRGRVVAKGAIDETVDAYLAEVSSEEFDTVETSSFTVEGVEIYADKNQIIKTFDSIEVKVRFVAKTDVADPGLYVSILTPDARRLTGLDFKDFANAKSLRAGETCELGFAIESLPLLPGAYQLEIHLKDMSRGLVEIVPHAYRFEVAETQVYGGRKLDSWFGNIGLRAHAFNGSRNGVKAKTCSN